MAFLQEMLSAASASGDGTPRLMPKAASFRVKRNTCQSRYRQINDLALEIRDMLLLAAEPAGMARVSSETSELRGVPIGNVRAMMLYAADATFAWSTADVKALTGGAGRTNEILHIVERLTFSRDALLECSEATQEATARALEEGASLLEEATIIAASANEVITRIKTKAELLGQRVGVKPVKVGSDAADGADAALQAASAPIVPPALPSDAVAASLLGSDAAATLGNHEAGLGPLIASTRGGGVGNRARGGTGDATSRLRSPTAAGGIAAANAASASTPTSLSRKGDLAPPQWLLELVSVCREALSIKPSCGRDPYASFRAQGKGRDGGVSKPAAAAAAASSWSSASSKRSSPARLRERPSGKAAANTGLRASAMRRAAGAAASGGILRPRGSTMGASAIASSDEGTSGRGTGGDDEGSFTPSGRQGIPPSLHLHIHSGQEFVDAAAGGMPSPAVVDASPEGTDDSEVEGGGDVISTPSVGALKLPTGGHLSSRVAARKAGCEQIGNGLATDDLLAVVHSCWTGNGPRPLASRIVSLTRTFGAGAAMACGGLGDWLGRNRDLGESAGLTGIKQAARTAVRAITPPISRS